MKKQFLSLLLSAALALGLTACGGGGGPAAGDNPIGSMMASMVNFTSSAVKGSPSCHLTSSSR